jgi:putative alpha-1,2-mannosidase
VEYSTNDFGLYQVAKGLGRSDDEATYLNRSRNWRNHWNPAASSTNHSGFMVPRRADGTFVSQDPLSCSGCYWGDAYYEDNAWVYSLNAIHDVYTMKKYIGGDEKFIDRINKLWDLNIFNAGNEPSFTTPYLYNFVRGAQWRTVERSRGIGKLYNSSPTGLPGNSDAGAMEANILVSLHLKVALCCAGAGAARISCTTWTTTTRRLRPSPLAPHGAHTTFSNSLDAGLGRR